MRTRPLAFRVVVWLCFAAVLAGVCVLLLTATTVVAQEPKGEPPTPSKPDSSKDIASNTVSLSVRADSGRDSTVLNIVWSGQEAESLLVVSVEPAEAAVFARETHPGETHLSGILLVRQARSQGEATIELPNERVSEFLGAHQGRIHVFLAQGVRIQFVTDDPTVKGAVRVDRAERIRPEDAGPEFRLVCTARNVASLSRVVPEAKPWSFEMAKDEHFHPVVECHNQLALLQFLVTFGGGDAP